MDIRKFLLAGLSASMTVTALAHDDWYRHERHEWRERAWREHAWRERVWRDHEWREHYYATLRAYYGYPGYYR